MTVPGQACDCVHDDDDVPRPAISIVSWNEEVQAACSTEWELDLYQTTAVLKVLVCR